MNKVDLEKKEKKLVRECNIIERRLRCYKILGSNRENGKQIVKMMKESFKILSLWSNFSWEKGESVEKREKKKGVREKSVK